MSRARQAVVEACAKLEQAATGYEDEIALVAWINNPAGEATIEAPGTVSHAAALTAALAQIRESVDGLAAGEHAPQPPARPEPDPITKRLIAKAKTQWG